jgi:hypothetical protein
MDSDNLGLVGFVGLVILHKTQSLGGAMLFAVSVLISLCAIGNSFISLVAFLLL